MEMTPFLVKLVGSLNKLGLAGSADRRQVARLSGDLRDLAAALDRALYIYETDDGTGARRGQGEFIRRWRAFANADLARLIGDFRERASDQLHAIWDDEARERLRALLEPMRGLEEKIARAGAIWMSEQPLGGQAPAAVEFQDLRRRLHEVLPALERQANVGWLGRLLGH